MIMLFKWLFSGPPLYNLLESSGLPHMSVFKMQVEFNGMTAVGEGSSKKQAKTIAALRLLAMLEGREPPESINGGSDVSGVEASPADDPGLVGNRVGDLQEFSTGKKLLEAKFEEKEPTGPPHLRNFTIVCSLGWVSEEAEGKTKKAAKRLAAHKVVYV